MKKILLYFAALAIVAVACERVDIEPQSGDDPSNEVTMITETISGGSGASTKVTIDAAAKFAWTVGDNVAVHVSNGDSHKYVFTSGEGGASVAAPTASFTVSYEAGYSRDAFAIYPSTIVAADAANYGQSGYALDVTLPASYTLDQVSENTSPCPMIADNTGASWEFKHLCGMLRLTVNGIPDDATGLVIQFPGKKVNGAFSIASPVTLESSTIATGVPADGEDKITITFDAGITTATINIPLPTGAYDDVYITSVGGSKKVAAFRPIKAGGYTALRAHAKKFTAALASFSVSASKQVFFSPGNLQYLGNGDGTGTWRFAEHQYDFMGDGPSSGTNYQGNVTVSGYTKYNASADLDVARDLFGWGTSGYNDKYPYMTSQEIDDYYDGSLTDSDYDWGVYHSASGNSTEKIINGGNYSWRLLTSEEWEYLMARESSDYDDYLYCLATLTGITSNDIYGMIIFPDGWTDNPSIDEYGDSDYDTNEFDADQWAILEALGCVFLPAAHVRDGNSFNPIYLNQGYYWASTAENSIDAKGTASYFENGWTLSNDPYSRKLGHSVRLIRDL